MNLPNKLTILRFCLVPVFVAVMMLPECILADSAVRLIAAVIFALTALTDLLDGKIARKYGLVTNFGKFMDPLADKFMVFGALLAIVARFEDIRPVMVWVALVVMLRELAITSLRLIAAGASEKPQVIAASRLGKVKTTVQCIAIVVILVEPVIFGFVPFIAEYHILTYISCIALVFMTLYSGIDYILKYSYLFKEAK